MLTINNWQGEGWENDNCEEYKKNFVSGHYEIITLHETTLTACRVGEPCPCGCSHPVLSTNHNCIGCKRWFFSAMLCFKDHDERRTKNRGICPSCFDLKPITGTGAVKKVTRKTRKNKRKGANSEEAVERNSDEGGRSIRLICLTFISVFICRIRSDFSKAASEEKEKWMSGQWLHW